MGEAKASPQGSHAGHPCKSPSGDLMEPPYPPPEQTINQRYDYALACERMRTDANGCERMRTHAYMILILSSNAAKKERK